MVQSRAREVRLCGATFVEPEGIIERGAISWVVVSKVRTFSLTFRVVLFVITLREHLQSSL